MTANDRLDTALAYPAGHARPAEPLPLPWALKPLGSAQYGVERLADARVRYWIRHEVVRGVTPAMLAWWFAHLEGEIEIEGRRVDRYRAWHPYDHVHASYVRRCADGTVGPGAAIRIVEYFGANRSFAVDVVTEIEQLDERGYIHNPIVYGVAGCVRMEYRFTRVATGTLYENCLIVGSSHGWKRQLNGAIARWLFDRAHGLAWIRHNVEEVGMFEHILPLLYAQEARTAMSTHA